MGMGDTLIDYEILVNNLIQLLPDIYAVAIVKGRNEIVYSTENWDISADVEKISSSWNSMKAPSIMVSGVKYIMLQCEIDCMVATSVKGEGHIVGGKNEEMKIITYIEPNGDIKAAIVEITRIIRTMSSKKSYVDENIKFGGKYQLDGTTETGAAHVDPQLKKEIEGFLKWIKDDSGLLGYIDYYLKQKNANMISELSKIYTEFRQIFGV